MMRLIKEKLNGKMETIIATKIKKVTTTPIITWIATINALAKRQQSGEKEEQQYNLQRSIKHTS